MIYPLVFACRCKPQDVDAIDLVLEHRRVFIGYPLRLPDTIYDPKSLRSCFADFGKDDVWNIAPEGGWRNSYSANKNLVDAVTPGSIVMVPRPERGLVFCGRISGPFELLDSPSWYEQYLEIRDEGGVDETQHAGDVAQGWPVEEWRSVSLGAIPGWIRRSFNFRVASHASTSMPWLDSLTQ